MDDTLDCWFNLACAILHRAVLDARQPSAGPACNIRARLFLLSEDCEWLAESLGLDVITLRNRALRQWTAKLS